MVDHCMAIFLVTDNIRGIGIFRIAMVSLGLERPGKDDQSYKWTVFQKVSASGPKHFIFASINVTEVFGVVESTLKVLKLPYVWP